MKEFLPSEDCPVRNILSRISSKWAILILATLNANGTMRFNDIHRSIGDISQRMLTLTIQTLVQDGLVNRKVYPEVPPRVEYTLSSLGEDLMPLLTSLVKWAMANKEAIFASRSKKLS